MATPGSDQRRFTRHHMALDVAVGPLQTHGSSIVEAQRERTVTVNLSLGGLCLYSNILYPVGTSLSCVVTIPGRALPLELPAAVVWFQRIEHDAQGYKLGLEFRKLSAQQRAALKTFFDHPISPETAKAKKLLLVDDDQELQLALRLRFEAAGYEVLTANDGLEGLRKGREEHPHLIILDLMLPRLNGYEVCRLLKFDQKFHHLPILLFTARCRSEDRDMGLAAGANAYITKPCHGVELLAKVDELLKVAPS